MLLRRKRLACPLVLTTGAALLLIPACGSSAPPPGQPFRVVSHGALAEAAKRAEGHACAIKGENLSGRGDPENCGPFPCDSGACVVNACTAAKDCYPGICADGYCILAAPHGSRTCKPRELPSLAPDGAAADFSAWAGCECAPQSVPRPRDQPMCGSFPCSPEGCYVKQCRGDGDCAYGMCSDHASGPHGYCVTDDDY